jgi:hypothetical protein
MTQNADYGETTHAVAEWRVKYPESDWSEWTPWTTGAEQTDAMVRLMLAEGNRLGGPDHQLYRSRWGHSENEIRIRSVSPTAREETP